jgi:hypothetical protein
LSTERVNLSALEHLRPRLLLSSLVLSPHLKLETPPPFDNTSIVMKLSDIDLELDAVDLVRLAFLAATAGVSMHYILVHAA